MSSSRSIKVDASEEGCSGMFWRTTTEMASTSNSSDWPRNGAIHLGQWITLSSGERWVKFDNGFYLPEKQKGFTILFDVTK